MTPNIIVKEKENKVQGIIYTSVYGSVRIDVCMEVSSISKPIENASLLINNENISHCDACIPLTNGDIVPVEVNEAFVKWTSFEDGYVYGSIAFNIVKNMECVPDLALLAANYMLNDSIIDVFKLEKHLQAGFRFPLEVNAVELEWVECAE